MRTPFTLARVFFRPLAYHKELSCVERALNLSGTFQELTAGFRGSLGCRGLLRRACGMNAGSA